MFENPKGPNAQITNIHTILVRGPHGKAYDDTVRGQISLWSICIRDKYSDLCMCTYIYIDM